MASKLSSDESSETDITLSEASTIEIKYFEPESSTSGVETQSECPINCHLPESSDIETKQTNYDLSKCNNYFPVLTAFSRLSFQDVQDIDSLVLLAEENIVHRMYIHDQPTPPSPKRLKLDTARRSKKIPFPFKPFIKKHLSTCYLTAEFWEKSLKNMKLHKRRLYSGQATELPGGDSQCKKEGEEEVEFDLNKTCSEMSKCYQFEIFKSITKDLLDLLDEVILLIEFSYNYPLYRYYVEAPQDLPINFVRTESVKLPPLPDKCTCEEISKTPLLEEIVKELNKLWYVEIPHLYKIKIIIMQTLIVCRDLPEDSMPLVVKHRSNTLKLLDRIGQIKQKCIQFSIICSTEKELGALTYLNRLNYQTNIACLKYMNYLNYLYFYLNCLHLYYDETRSEISIPENDE